MLYLTEPKEVNASSIADNDVLLLAKSSTWRLPWRARMLLCLPRAATHFKSRLAIRFVWSVDRW